MEDELLNCVRNSFTDREDTLDSLMNVFESELIIEGLLESRDADDYRGLLQRIASEQPIMRGMDSYFFTRFRNLVPDSTTISSCVETMERYIAQFPSDRLGQALTLREESIARGMRPSEQASAFLDILDAVAFELPIYRFMTYHLIDGQAYETATTSANRGLVSPPGLGNEFGANTFTVRMNKFSQVITADQLVTFEALLPMVQMHARRFEAQARYVVETEEDVKYESFIILKDQIALAISQVRDDYARRYLGKTLIELTPDEKKVVFDKYPIRIVSPR